ncbi:phospholysine phosphohistidine inorganic pyrophosphate phosphatase-like isoform X3 [Amblyomma americanum]
MAWLRKPIRGILMDITGVLYESGERKAIEGSTEAVKMLRAANIPFRFITNETQKTREQLDSLLHRLGFDIYEKEIFMCVPAAKKFIHDLNYRPFLLVHPITCSLFCRKYYREHGELVMDVGPFAAALEFAAERQAIVIGKPGEEFFRLALEDMKLRADEVVMVGDDIVSDVGGAQSVGMRGVLVRTGKYRSSDESHPSVKPDGIVRNLKEAVERIVTMERPYKPVVPQ